jgi:hypothetical protein
VVRQSNAVDFWRGFALVSIFINHIPGIYFDRFTHKNVSLSDSADLFVFLAGWALRLVSGPPEDPVPAGQLLNRLGRRALTIYAAHMLIVSIAIAMLAGAARILDNPLILEWHNAAAVFYDPVSAHIGLVLLTYQLGYFDILPLYVVLMVAAPAIALIHRQAPNLLLPISLAIYLLTLVFQISIPSWPTGGNWFFNPLAWQLIFVLGFLLARERGIGGFARTHIFWIRIAALPIVIVGALMALFDWWPDPTKMPEPRLLFVLSKPYATPLRLLQFLAIVAVFSTIYPYVAWLVSPVAKFFSKLGRNSLNVFCVGSILSLACQIGRFVYGGDIFIDTAVVIAGAGMLWLTAWASEWQATRSSRS